ncbi:MAG: trigger factor [Peptococcaceae bacterium]|nr:trigger factor [Peptococcaceae bacterium]
MKANAEKIEKNTVLLEIEIDAESFSQAVDKAFRRLVKKVNVPGFRKGKAPRQIFERMMGKGVIIEEAMESVVPDAYYKAVEDTGIEPIDQPKIDIVQAEEGQPVIFKATVQVKPEVTLGQYKGLEVSKHPVDVPEEEVDRSLERLQNRHAKLLTMEEGTVEKGDTAVIDFLGKVDGVPFKGGEGKEYSLEIGSGSFIPGFEDQLVGQKVGETRDIFVTFPENYQAEELAGKDATFTVTVNTIKRKETVALDDEFAKDVSEFDTLEELRADIANKLKENAESQAKYGLRQEIVNKVVDNAEVEIPDVMVENQLRYMMGNFERRLATQGMTLDSYLQFAKTTRADFEESMRPDAIWSAKSNLVMEAIAKQENIEPTAEEIDAEAAKIAQYLNQDLEQFKAAVESKGQIDYIKDQIVREKTLQFLVDNAVIIEGASGEPAWEVIESKEEFREPAGDTKEPAGDTNEPASE